jgi:hypothetical protein
VGTTLAGVVFTTWVVTTAVNVTAKVCTTESEPSVPCDEETANWLAPATKSWFAGVDLAMETRIEPSRTSLPEP